VRALRPLSCGCLWMGARAARPGPCEEKVSTVDSSVSSSSGRRRWRQCFSSGVETPVDALHDGSAEVRLECVRKLARAPALHCDVLAQFLDDEDAAVRLAAVSALGQSGGVAEPLAPAVAVLLCDPSWRVRRAAAAVLGKMGPAGALHLQEVTELLGDSESSVRFKATEAILRLVRCGGEVELVAALLLSGSALLRCAAAETLGRLGSFAAQHCQEVAGLLSDHDAKVRASAAWALGKLGAHLAEPQVCLLVTTLEDADSAVRLDAVLAVASLGEVAGGHYHDIAKLISDVDPGVRAAAQDALRRIGQTWDGFWS